jgi:putative alpha-1,2-mannosidase
MKQLNIKMLILSRLMFFLLLCYKSYSQVQYVNPLIGTNERVISGVGKFELTDRGKTYPLVGVPNGMNNWTPQTLEGERKNYPPYYYGDKGVQGSAVKDYGTFTIMPVSGQLITGAKDRASAFSHDKEVSSPMYYSVFLERYKVLAELTGLSRSAMMKFEFQSNSPHYVVVEPNSDVGDGYVEIIPERNEIVSAGISWSGSINHSLNMGYGKTVR